ncbi:MAG: ribosome recycling factor [candidate division WOR-3 bacterium]
MLEEIYKDARDRMSRSTEAFKQELGRIRTGRASPQILEGVRVDAYGSSIPLNQVATISVPEPRLLVLSVWDKSLVGEVERAILKSGLGLNPIIQGSTLRIPIPPLSEERRAEMVKLVRKMAEDARIAVRNIRRDAMEMVRDLEKEKEISEDDRRAAETEIQKITDEFIQKIDKLLSGKEKELMEF